MIENPVRDIKPIGIEKNGEGDLFEFEHSEGPAPVNLTVRAKVIKDLQFPNLAPRCHFTIKVNDRECGSITGEIRRGKKDGAVEFRAGSSNNSTKIGPEEKSDLPRVVGASIRELICRGYVTRWYSSTGLTFHGRKLYGSYLSSDSRLHVVRGISRSEPRYLVTAKPQAK